MDKKELREEIAEAREAVRQIAEKYHILAPLVTMESVITDSKGRMIDKTEQLAKSYTRNGYNLFTENMSYPNVGNVSSASIFGDGYLSYKSTDGAVAHNSGYAYGYNLAGTEYILIGTGTTAESFEDYALAAEIASGTGTGQMVRGTQSQQTLWYGTPKTMRTTFTRAFTNNSGGTINVAESGLTVGVAPVYYTSYSLSSVLVQRDVFTPEAVETGHSYTKTYTFDVVYPS